MEVAYSLHGAKTRSEFKEVLRCLTLDNACAWTDGTWYFEVSDVRRWDKIQNTQPDIRVLGEHLVRIVRDQNIDRVNRIIQDLAKGPYQHDLVENLNG